jgi:hypothetical protein
MEVILHTLGLCGEKHMSIVALLLEYPSISHTFSYIKTLFK